LIRIAYNIVDHQPNILQDRLEIMKKLEKQKEQLIQTGEMTPFGGFASEASTSHVYDQENQTTDKHFADEDDYVDTTTANQSSEKEIESDEYIPDEDELKDSWHDRETSKPKGGKLKRPHVSSFKASQGNRPNAVYKEDDAVEVRRKKPKKVKDHFTKSHKDDGDEHGYRKRIR